MKYLNITYHMYRNNETAETCITLPMASEVADDILTNQYDSPYTASVSPIGCIISALADLQSYDSGLFCCAEERNPYAQE